ncbi:MAG TPA: TIGR03986 family CRISPR-associated RAMP protein [Pirellulales bacterium]
MASGKLSLGPNKKLLMFEFTNRNGKTMKVPAPQTQLSQELARKPLKELDGLDVDFDEVAGQPKKLRTVGQEWIDPSAPPPRPAAPPRPASGGGYGGQTGSGQHGGSGHQGGRRDAPPRSHDARPPREDRPAASRPAPAPSAAPAAPTERRPLTLPSVKAAAEADAAAVRAARAAASRPAPVDPTAPPTEIPPPAFHHAYNFIPAPPRESVAGDLGDAAPCAHDRYAAGRYTGWLRVRLTTQTPLLALDDSATVRRADGHPTTPIRLGPDGRPALAPASVRGMLRAAYEAATNSRFGVFSGWDSPLTHRPAEASQNLIPARVERDANGKLVLRLLHAAKLPAYQRTSARPDKGRWIVSPKFRDNTVPQHGDHLWVKLEGDGPTAKVVQLSRASEPRSGDGWYEGWAFVTGPNTATKLAERVFYVVPGKEETIPADDLAPLWTNLIQQDRARHAAELTERKLAGKNPGDYLGPNPGQTAWSRHLWASGADEFAPGTLLYVERDGERVIALTPVSFSRKFDAASPRDLLPPSLQPAKSLEELSPADRVFGWSAPSGESAYRGGVRVGAARCEADDMVERFPAPGLPLAALAAPKPQSGRFYLAENAAGNPLPAKGDDEFAPGKFLRGRKVYPHHAGTPAEAWIGPVGKKAAGKPPVGGEQTEGTDSSENVGSPENVEAITQSESPAVAEVNSLLAAFRRSGDLRDVKNRSVLGWVKRDASFLFELHVENLSPVELGALVWLLSLPEGAYLRLGAARPLGFGSVRLSIVDSELRSGEGWAKHYSTFDDVEILSDDRVDLPALAAKYEQELLSVYGQGVASAADVPFIAAFLSACRGRPETGLPTLYPRVADGSGSIDESAGWEWFASNERATTAGPAYGLALPALANDVGLPKLPPPPLAPLEAAPAVAAHDPRGDRNRAGQPRGQGNRGQGNRGGSGGGNRGPRRFDRR